MNLPEKPTDRRVLRTKKNIRQAFLHLLSEKSLSQITVKELSDLADINRKTFYMYYSNIEDIFAELEDELVLKLVHVFEKELFQKEMFNSYSFFENLNHTIQEDIDLYRILNHSDLLPHLIQRAKNALIEVFFRKYNISADSDNERYILYAEYAASGILSMYTKWFSRDFHMSLEELTRTAAEITLYGLQHLLPQT
ncbi:probable dihydroxyacetone kinase regulator [uncultured Clostridium sp.]|uniref:TetR family transcriptional regulator C-terminal domain-containing protein n=1 Tax=Muricoprocola aceti TaxID=2981772 RepID=A0ABT2SIY4_9FIRM|nr:TetR-like C-terminal domain-containing protein [Muricoprocola aceti]MCI7226540.1 TetR family transcriptional regulator C-terminal domain-containing protein [Lachnospiraceae bacterium]MCU6724465.1 TetR family transcriptional regulator C-terminal domain-containing protein [Muricoprocola aceti]SCH13289.1 probable dihydroxyacetone kinase regulator [uncultured Clostridium sp.]